MANVLTNLAHDIYLAKDQVVREATGLTNSVTVNSGSEQVAQGDSVRSFVTRAANVNSSASPSMTIPEGDDQTVDTKTMTVSQIASVRIPWTGEDMKHVNNGFGFETVYGDQIKQAMRAIVNTIEAHVATVCINGASRAVGTAGTTPFASNFNTIAQLRQVLFDNGMPVTDGRLSLVVNSDAGTNLRNLAQLQKVNEAGADDLLRRGELLNLQGFSLKESAQIQSHTIGTGSGYQLNGAVAVGDTTVNVDTGTGTVVAGDIVTITGDSVHKYVVNTALSGGSFTIGGPGIRTAEADNTAIAVGSAYVGNVGLHQSAVELVMRPLAKPLGGDAAVDEMIVQDPMSGLVFRISAYKGYNKAMFDVTCLYQAKVWKSEGVAILLG